MSASGVMLTPHRYAATSAFDPMGTFLDYSGMLNKKTPHIHIRGVKLGTDTSKKSAAISGCPQVGGRCILGRRLAITGQENRCDKGGDDEPANGLANHL